MWSVIILLLLLLPFTSLSNVSIMLPIIEWCESNFPIWNKVHSSGIKQLDYSVGKIDVFWKTFDKVRGKIVKIIKIFEKLEHITHFGSKITGHLLCRYSISYHLRLNSLSTCNWSNIQKKKKKITPDCCLLVLRCSSFSNILIILTILLLTLCHCCPAQESLALKG